MAKRLMFKVEKNRVLVPVGEPCPFGCKYCYTRGGEVGLSKLDPVDVLQQFEQFAREASFDTIQFGYDGDPFARPETRYCYATKVVTPGQEPELQHEGTP